MVQRRIQDYGTLAEALDIKTIIYGLARSTVLQGFRFGIAGMNKLTIFNGIAVTDRGVMIIEDELQDITVPITASAQDYTVMYDHIDEDISGGVPAEIKLANGILSPEDISGVILGYIKYPGGAVPLNTGFFLQEPEVLLRNFIPNRQNADWVIPLKGNGYMQTKASGSALTISDIYDELGFYLRIQNNVSGPTLATATFTFPFKVNNIPYSLFQARMQVGIGATVEFKLIDSMGNPADITVAPLSSSKDFSLYSYNIAKEAIQTPNTIIYLQMLLNISTTKQIKLQGLGLSPYNLPI